MSILVNPWLELVHDNEIVYVIAAVDIEQQKPSSRESIYGIYEVSSDFLTDELLTKYNIDAPIETLWHDYIAHAKVAI